MIERRRLKPGRPRQCHRREERGTSDLDIEMLGLESGLGGGDIGPAHQQFRRQTGGNRRQGQCRQCVRPHVDRLGRVAGQNPQPNHRLIALIAQIRHHRSARGDESFLLGHVQIVGGPGGSATPNDGEGLFGIGEVAFRDTQTIGQVQRREPGRCDVCHHGQRHGLPVESAEHRIGHRGLPAGGGLAPEIEFVRRAQPSIIAMGIDAAAAQTTAAGIRAAVLPTRAAGSAEGRQQRRAGDSQLRIGLTDARDGGRDIRIMDARICDQCI